MNVYIKEILAQKGLTQKDIAEKLGALHSPTSPPPSRAPRFPL